MRMHLVMMVVNAHHGVHPGSVSASTDLAVSADYGPLPTVSPTVLPAVITLFRVECGRIASLSRLRVLRTRTCKGQIAWEALVAEVEVFRGCRPHSLLRMLRVLRNDETVWLRLRMGGRRVLPLGCRTRHVHRCWPTDPRGSFLKWRNCTKIAKSCCATCCAILDPELPRCPRLSAPYGSIFSCCRRAAIACSALHIRPETFSHTLSIFIFLCL